MKVEKEIVMSKKEKNILGFVKIKYRGYPELVYSVLEDINRGVGLSEYVLMNSEYNNGKSFNIFKNHTYTDKETIELYRAFLEKKKSEAKKIGTIRN
jgi:hypothetical protein